MNCLNSDEMATYLEQEVSVARSAEIEVHLGRCADCENRRQEICAITSRIGSDLDEFSSPDFAAKVVARVRRPDALASRRWSRRWLLPVGVALAAAGLLFTVLARDAQQIDGFAPRGTELESSDRWVSVQVFRPNRELGTYEPVGDEMAADDRLVFSVANAERSPHRHVMIFAVQNDGEVFWYYPAFETPGTNPSSIDVRAGAGPVYLREEIQHELRRGWLRVFAVFSRVPLDVLSVETVVATEMGGRSVEAVDRLPIRDTGQQSVLLKVETTAGAE